MALQLVTPIIAQTMMACTQPFNYTEVASNEEVEWTTILPNYEQNNTKYFMTEKRCHVGVHACMYLFLQLSCNFCMVCDYIISNW